VLQTPNADSPWGTMHRYNDFAHEVCFNPNALSRLMSLTGFRDIELREAEPVPWGSTALPRRWRASVWQMFRCLQDLESRGVGKRRQRHIHAGLPNFRSEAGREPRPSRFRKSDKRLTAVPDRKMGSSREQSNPPRHRRINRALTERKEIVLKVFFCSRIGLDAFFNREMNRTIAGNMDLTSGYDHIFLAEAGEIKETSVLKSQ
jgi:hypothetical protein